MVIMASESGAINVDPKSILRKWRLQPGKIFLIDQKKKRIIDDAEVKSDLVDTRPWKRWIEENMTDLESLPEAQDQSRVGDQSSVGSREPGVKAPAVKAPAVKAQGAKVASLDGTPTTDTAPESPAAPELSTLGSRLSTAPDLLDQQHAFGYTNEDLRLLMTPMAATGQEAVGSMGTDTPLACLSERPQLLFNYFKQLFAQVTNPPLDAIREALVTSLITYLGREGNLLTEEPSHCRLIKLKTPILSNAELSKLAALDDEDHKAARLSALFDPNEGVEGMSRALELLCERAVEQVRDQRVSVLILTDHGVDAGHAAIPSLLLTSAVHHHLIRAGVRAQAGLVIETGEAREAHHFALLIGYGAGAVNPYLALDTIADLHADGLLPDEVSVASAQKNFIKAVNKSILKVASKMGISTVQSYRGAQIFEAIGLGPELIARHFTGTPSRLGGIEIDDVATETLVRHRRAFPPITVDKGTTLDAGGYYQWRRSGEFHQWNPDTVAKLQHAVRVDSFDTFREYTRLIDDESRARCTLRGLLTLKPASGPVPIDEVEPAKEIVKRFCTGAMSFGSISAESHETLAIAMNRVGGRSNTGEGGEDPARFKPDAATWPDGEPMLRRSAIKQIASARFGVTTE